MKINLFLTLILLFLLSNLYSQSQREIDSLKKIINNPENHTFGISTKVDTTLIQTLYFLSKNLALINPEDAREYGLRALKIIDTCNKVTKTIPDDYYQQKLPIINKALSVISEQLGEYDNAINYLKISLPTLQKKNDFNFIAMCYNSLAQLYRKIGNNKLALDYAHSALEISEKNKYNAGICSALKNVGLIYSYQEMHNLALPYYERIIPIREKLNAQNLLIGDYINLANTYDELKKNNEAIICLNKALNLSKKLNLKDQEALCLNNISYYFIDKKKYNEALSYCTEANKINIEIGDIYGVSSTLKAMSNCYFFLNNEGKAIEKASEALEIANKIGNIDLKKDLSNNLYEYYYKIGKYKEAIIFYKDYIEIKDSLLNKDIASQMNDLSTKYQTKKKEQENQLLQTQNQLSTETIKQQRLITYFVIAGLLFVVFLAAFIFNGLKKQRKANKIISLQKTEVEKQKHLVEEHQKEILDSIRYAKRIQTALLANKEFVNTNIKNNFIYFQPKDIVSGDFYWATQQDNCFYLACCDSTGHGVPGAFMSLLNIGFLSEAIKEKNISQPNEIFNYVRKRLIDSISAEGQKDGFDGILIKIKSSDLQSNQSSISIEYSAANNEPILISNNQIIELPKDKMPVGQGERKESFALHTLELKKGETLYLYTDGYADQFGGEKGKKFKYKQLNELLLHIHQLPMQEQEQKLSTTFNNWKGNLEQVDDVCVIGIKF